MIVGVNGVNGVRERDERSWSRCPAWRGEGTSDDKDNGQRRTGVSDQLELEVSGATRWEQGCGYGLKSDQGQNQHQSPSQRKDKSGRTMGRSEWFVLLDKEQSERERRQSVSEQLARKSGARGRRGARARSGMLYAKEAVEINVAAPRRDMKRNGYHGANARWDRREIVGMGDDAW